MEIVLTGEMSEGLSNLRDVSVQLSRKIGAHFKSRSYGNGVASIFIGIICVSPEFDFFFKIRKPKYKRGKEKIVHDGVEHELESALRYDLKLNFKDINGETESRIATILEDQIIASLDIFDKLDIKDFDKEAFKVELIHFLKDK